MVDSSANIVRLNVGGTIYMTTLATVRPLLPQLVQMPPNGATITANNQPTIREYFIDRDGTLFRYILRYLRDGRVSLPEGFSEIDALIIEAEHYPQIPDIVDDFKQWYQDMTASKTLKMHLLEFVQNERVPSEMVRNHLMPDDYRGPFFDYAITALGDPASILWMTNGGVFSCETSEVTLSEDDTSLHRRWYDDIEAGQTGNGYVYGFGHPRSPISKAAVFAQIKELGYTLTQVYDTTGANVTIDPLLRPFITLQSAKTFEFVASC